MLDEIYLPCGEMGPEGRGAVEITLRVIDRIEGVLNEGEFPREPEAIPVV
jgi:hypothetical protein